MQLDGSKLRTARMGQLVTQEDLAKRTGISEATISRLENGLQSARISTIRKLALALGVPAPDIMSADADAHKEAA